MSSGVEPEGYGVCAELASVDPTEARRALGQGRPSRTTTSHEGGRTHATQPVDWMDEIASESVLPQAYTWLCERRREYPPNYDVWNVRWQWEEIRPQLQDQLRAGAYRLGPVRHIHYGDETIEVWSALDALVLKLVFDDCHRPHRPRSPSGSCGSRSIGAREVLVSDP
jgi:hypothetical protein